MKLHELENHLRHGGLVRRKIWEPKEQGLSWTEYWSIRVESIFADDWEPEGVRLGAPAEILQFTKTVWISGKGIWDEGRSPTHGTPEKSE